MDRKQIIFWLFTFSLFSFLILPGLFMDGMFADGTQYACVSKHLAEGKGTFWFPFLSETWHRQGGHFFLEQPPLMYALQSLFFIVFGNGMFTERIYILVTLIVTSFLVVLIWRSSVPPKYKQYSWLPLLLWISIPLMSWTYRQNMQENTMVMFTTSAIYFGIRSARDQKHSLLYAILTGIFIFLATFTKGIPGLFPLVTAGAIAVSTGRIKIPRAILLTSIYLAIPVVLYVTLYFSSENAAQSLEFYVRSRLFQRITTAPVVDSHFYMLGRLLLELIPAMIILILIGIAGRNHKRWQLPDSIIVRKSLMFLLLGMAGSLPLMITLVQRAFYMSISFPLFGIAFALLAVPSMEQVNLYLSRIKSLKYLQYLLVITSLSGILLTVLLAGKPGKSRDLLEDVYRLGDHLEPGQRISCDGPSYQNWPFQFYMLRYNDIYLEKSPGTLKYFLVEKGSLPESAERYKKMQTETTYYDLYIKTGQ